MALERYYKLNRTIHKDIDSFMRSDDIIGNLVNKLKSGKAEISKQLKSGLALQRGIIAECVFMQTLAEMLGLDKCYDFEGDSDMPVEVSMNLHKLRQPVNFGHVARYAYYEEGNNDTVLFQRGNPAVVGDASLVSGVDVIIIEIKDMPALLIDKDLEYDEQGKLIITDQLTDMYPNCVSVIEAFNAEASVMSMLGHNHPILTDDELTTSNLVNSYFNTHSVDVIISSKEDRLVAFTGEQLTMTYPNNDSLISTVGSEIRTTGKNSRKKAFTPLFLMETLQSHDVLLENGTCTIHKDNDMVIGYTTGRGRTDKTRFKINHCFFVRSKSITETDTDYRFNIDDISQSKSGISIHITLEHSYEELKSLLGL